MSFSNSSNLIAARLRLLPLMLLFLALAVPNGARAEFVFTLTEVGNDVVVTGSGTLNLNALTFQEATPNYGVVIESRSALLAVGTGVLLRQYTGISGPEEWGPGFVTSATASSGDIVVIAGVSPSYLYVPINYVSGAPLANSVTFSDTTILGLGFVPGTYTYNWGFGGNADSLTVTSVPEPGTWTFVSASLLAVFGLLRSHIKRRKA